MDKQQEIQMLGTAGDLPVAALEQREPGSGIHGILLSAPIADAVAAVVILWLTVSFFKKLGKEKWVLPTDHREKEI